MKPSRAGSSIGITKVTDWAQFPDAVATAAAVDPKVIVEAVGPRAARSSAGCSRARAAALPEASLPAEIRLRPGVDWYDFAAKYLDDACRLRRPGRPDAGTDRGGAGGRPPGVPGAGLRRAWPGSTSSWGRRPTAATTW